MRTLQITGLEGRADVHPSGRIPLRMQENCLLYLQKLCRKCKRGSREEGDHGDRSYPFPDLFHLRAYAGLFFPIH